VFEIGSSLRAAREHQKLGLADVERATHIRRKYLQALEDERWEVLPGTAYVKGFLRTYADFLGLASQRFVEEFTERFTPAEPFEPPALVRVRRRRRLRDARLLVFPLLAVAVGLFSWRLASGGGGEPRPAYAPAPPSTRVRTTTPKPAPTPAARARVELVAARGPCWLEARVGGKQVYARTLEQGGHARFVGRRVWLRLGAPWNLVATVNGKPLQLPRVTGNVVVSTS
jgi:cytoskeleton protein RodZ